MNPKETSAQLGSLSQDSIIVDDQISRGYIQQVEDMSSVKPLAHSSKQPSPASEDSVTVGRPSRQPSPASEDSETVAYSSEQPSPASQDNETVDVLYKIVGSDLYEYSLKGNVYFRYNIYPGRRGTGWFCIVAFHWHDVRAEFECVYHPTITLFDDFKPIEGTFEGGRGGIRSVELSMWNFADRGPDLNPEHTVNDDNGNRIMLAIMITGSGLAVRLYGKLIREGDKESEVWLSKDERRRLGLPP